MSRAYYCGAVILMAIWSSACHSDAANAPTLSASTLVFDEGDGGPGFTALYSIGSDGRNRRKVTSSGTQPITFAIAPDGRHIAVTVDGSRIAFARTGPYGTDIATMNVEGSNIQVLTSIHRGAGEPATLRIQ